MRKIKKICFITTISDTLEGFVLPFAKFLLSETDWEIYMICNPNEKFLEKLPKEIKYIPVSMKRGISFSGIKAIFKMIAIFKKEKFDMIQYSTPNASLYASLAGKLTNVPVRLYCQWGMVFVGMKGIKKRVFKKLEKLICFLSTWIEPDSKSNLEFAHLEKLYPSNKGSVIGKGSACGVKLDKFDIEKKEYYRKIIREKYNISKDAFVFGYVGRITRDKGIDELLVATKEILKNFQEIYLLNIGGKEKIEELNQEFYKWSLSCKNIIYTGIVNNVEQYLSAMDCYILPSYREGFGMGIIEAEAMEVPVIVTNIPGPIDAIKKDITGKIVNKADWESLYHNMVDIYKMDILERKKMGSAGRKFVEENFEQNNLFKLILEDRIKLLSKI